MAVTSMKQLLEAGVHFGHQTRRWNPKMKKYIYGERNGIHTRLRLERTFFSSEPKSRLRKLSAKKRKDAECTM